MFCLLHRTDLVHCDTIFHHCDMLSLCDRLWFFTWVFPVWLLRRWIWWCWLTDEFIDVGSELRVTLVDYAWAASQRLRKTDLRHCQKVFLRSGRVTSMPWKWTTRTLNTVQLLMLFWNRCKGLHAQLYLCATTNILDSMLLAFLRWRALMLIHRCARAVNMLIRKVEITTYCMKSYTDLFI